MEDQPKSKNTEHKCRKTKLENFRHWFGESSSESTSSESDSGNSGYEEEENWRKKSRKK